MLLITLKSVELLCKSVMCLLLYICFIKSFKVCNSLVTQIQINYPVPLALRIIYSVQLALRIFSPTFGNQAVVYDTPRYSDLKILFLLYSM